MHWALGFLIGPYMLASVAAGLAWLLHRHWEPREDKDLPPRLRDRVPFLLGVLTACAAFCSLVASIWFLWQIEWVQKYEWSSHTLVYVDGLSAWFNFIVAAVGFVASLHCIGYIHFHHKLGPRSAAGFYFLYNAFLVSMLLVQVLNNLILLFVAVEVTTLVSGFLVLHERRKASVEAAWKYVSVCSVGIVFALLGTLLLAFAFKNPNEVSLDLTWLLGASDTVSAPDFVKLAFLFALVGYGTKAGLAPLHTWLPDGHAEAPSPVSALLSGVLLKSALFAILRFYGLLIRFLPEEDGVFAAHVLLFAGLASILLAVPFILKQNSRKRLFAYHSLEHMGIIFFAVGLGTPIGLFVALLHSLYHALNKALMFILNAGLEWRQPPLDDGKEKRPLLEDNLLMGILFVIGGLALVGAPPFAIFTTELMILRESIRMLADNTWASTMGGVVAFFVLAMVAIFGGLINHLGTWILGRPPKPPKTDPEEKTEDAPVQEKGTRSWQDATLEVVSVFIPALLLLGLTVIFGLGVPECIVEILRVAVTCVIPEGVS